MAAEMVPWHEVGAAEVAVREQNVLLADPVRWCEQSGVEAVHALACRLSQGRALNTVLLGIVLAWLEDGGRYQQVHGDTDFWEYVEGLTTGDGVVVGIAEKYARNLMAVGRMIRDVGLSVEDAARLGVGKLLLLVPAWNAGVFTRENAGKVAGEIKVLPCRSVLGVVAAARAEQRVLGEPEPDGNGAEPVMPSELCVEVKLRYSVPLTVQEAPGGVGFQMQAVGFDLMADMKTRNGVPVRLQADVSAAVVGAIKGLDSPARLILCDAIVSAT